MDRSSDRPFGETLRALMGERKLTYRSLADETRCLDGRGMTHSHINMLANGHDAPSMRAMELIARACEVQPAYFAEYRLAAAMRELDPTEVGLERANLLADGRLRQVQLFRRAAEAADARDPAEGAKAPEGAAAPAEGVEKASDKPGTPVPLVPEKKVNGNEAGP